MIDLKQTIGAKEKISDSAYLTIKKNTFCYDDALIQVSNISNITIGSSTEFKVPLWLSCSIWICMCALLISFLFHSVGFMFLLFLLWIGLIYILYVRFTKKKIIKYLVLHLNSGNIISFRCENEKFLKNVIKMIDNSMNTGRVMKINFKECNIAAKQIGDNNQIHEDSK